LAIRTFDVGAAAIALLILAPLLLAIMLVVRLDSPGPVLIRCERVGRRRRPLRMLKFRKMHDGATGAPLTLDGDDRFTRAGKWLARLSLDEIPQLWHVLIGEMSLVGPRPEDRRFVAAFDLAYDQILELRPGIVGLSQLAYLAEGRILNADDRVGDYLERILPQKIALDLLYVERRSLLLNLKILLWTVVAVVLRRPVAVSRASGQLRLRTRETS
jgi:lipopolysaccharide/colanic/teichoic acid biosynthesis glycosyltransferase